MGNLRVFVPIAKGSNFVTFFLLYLMKQPFKMGSTIRRKILFLREQTLSFKSCQLLKRMVKMKMTELFPLDVHVYPKVLKYWDT